MVKLIPASRQARRLLYEALQKDGRAVRDVLRKGEVPISFVEAAFQYCVEGFQEDPGKVYELDHIEMQEGAWLVFEAEILKPAPLKKK